jgi:hypothetical protein
VRETAAVSITPEPEKLVFSTASTTEAAIHVFYDLTVPLIFDNGAIKEDSGTVLAMVDTTSNKAYSTWRGAKLAHRFTIDPRRTTTEIRMVCSNSTNEISVCDNNYQFLTNTLETTTNDAGFFSSRETKLRTAMYLLMKQEYLDAETSHIIPLVRTDVFTGYLLYAGSTATALVFGERDLQQPYQLVFSNMTPEEIETVLRGIALQ